MLGNTTFLNQGINYILTAFFVLSLLSSHLFSQNFGDPIECEPISEHCFKGNPNDGTGNGNNAVLNGPLDTLDRNFNSSSAYFFDGIDDYMTIPFSQYLQDTFTYAVWVNLSDFPNADKYYCILGIGGTGADQAIMFGNDSRNGQIGFGIHSYQVGYAAKNYYTGTLPNKNVWYHLTYTRTPFKGKLYVDGVVVDSMLLNNSKADYGTNPGVVIGNRPSIDQFFSGVIDDLAIYPCELSSTEVNTLYLSKKCMANSLSNREYIAKEIDYKSSFFPNPSNGEVTISLDQYILDVSCRIQDMAGRLVCDKELGSGENFILELPTESGLYLLTIYDDNGPLQSFKILRE